MLSIAYGLPHPVVDGNVERVITRYLRLSGNPKQSALARRLTEISAGWISQTRAGDYNQALMELGATVCTPKQPSCERCPLSKDCAGRKRGDHTQFPELPKPRATEKLELDAGLLHHRGRYLIGRTDDFPFLDGLWVFPLADTTSGKSDIATVLSAQLSTEIRVRGELRVVRHSITYRRLVLRPKLLEATDVTLKSRNAFRWAQLDAFGKTVPVSSMCMKIAKLL